MWHLFVVEGYCQHLEVLPITELGKQRKKNKPLCCNAQLLGQLLFNIHFYFPFIKSFFFSSSETVSCIKHKGCNSKPVAVNVRFAVISLDCGIGLTLDHREKQQILSMVVLLHYCSGGCRKSTAGPMDNHQQILTLQKFKCNTNPSKHQEHADYS